jgi:hypothetical protein
MDSSIIDVGSNESNDTSDVNDDTCLIDYEIIPL